MANKKIFVDEISLNGLKNNTANKRRIVQDYIYNQRKGTRLYQSRESDEYWEKQDSEPGGLWKFSDESYYDYSEDLVKEVAREYNFDTSINRGTGSTSTSNT